MKNYCGLIHQLAGQLKRYRYPYQSEALPSDGIYLMFEKGESGHSGDRIVRVGSHTGNDQLPSRIDQHYLKENKDRSIFRKNIGRAILNKNKDPFLNLWNLDLTTRIGKNQSAHLVDENDQKQIEARVSEYIRNNISFVVFEVPDQTIRLSFEKMMIATVAQCPECGASPEWFGHHSPKVKIRQSGLWQEQHIADVPLKANDIALLTEFMK